MRRALSDAHPRVFDCKKESVCSLDPERLFSDGQDAVREHFGRERFLFRQVSGSSEHCLSPSAVFLIGSLI